MSLTFRWTALRWARMSTAAPIRSPRPNCPGAGITVTMKHLFRRFSIPDTCGHLQCPRSTSIHIQETPPAVSCATAAHPSRHGHSAHQTQTRRRNSHLTAPPRRPCSLATSSTHLDASQRLAAPSLWSCLCRSRPPAIRCPAYPAHQLQSPFPHQSCRLRGPTPMLIARLQPPPRLRSTSPPPHRTAGRHPPPLNPPPPRPPPPAARTSCAPPRPAIPTRCSSA